VLALAFLACQAVWAERSWVCEKVVAGTICEILFKTDEEPSAIVVSPNDCSSDLSPLTVYGIPFNKLEKTFGLVLVEGTPVKILAHECPAEEGQLKACAILKETTEGGEEVWIVLRPGNEKSKGKNK
jgi:hypothetical protein